MEIQELEKQVKRNKKKIEENLKKLDEKERRNDNNSGEPLSREAQEEIAKYLGLDDVSNEQIEHAIELLNDIDSWLDANDIVQVDYEQGYHIFRGGEISDNRTRTLTIKVNGGARDTQER